MAKVIVVGATVTIQDGQVTVIEGGNIYGVRYDQGGVTTLDLSALAGGGP